MRFQSEIAVLKFLRRCVNDKHLMRFRSENAVLKFLLRFVFKTLKHFKVLDGFNENCCALADTMENCPKELSTRRMRRMIR